MANDDQNLQENIEDETEQDESEISIFKYSITSYGADYPVDSLVKRMREGSIYVPEFQREYVWNLSDASGFIESLLLGLPVPGIFLAKEENSQKLLVIDGQQRLKTLQYFYDGIFVPNKKVFALQSVQKQFKGVTYKTLVDDDRIRLDDSIIHATIVKQDVPTDDDSSVYYIFERLNTRGRRLYAQEIRASIYHGAFNSLLGKLNNTEAWRKIFGKTSARLKDQELILRFFAFYFNWGNYARPMKEFLNQFMAKNRELDKYPENDLKDLFVKTVNVAYKALEEKAFKAEKYLNAAVFDAVMVGLASRLNKGDITDTKLVKQAYDTLLSDERFKDAYERSTSNEEKVQTRIELAIKAFDKIK